MNPSTALHQAFARTFELRGRSSRTEFWILYGAVTAVSLVLQYAAITWPSTGLGFAAPAVSLITFVPLFTATVRRLHDRDHSAWWLIAWSTASLFLFLFGLFMMVAHDITGLSEAVMILIVGVIFLAAVAATARVVVELARPGTPGPNRYGDPEPQRDLGRRRNPPRRPPSTTTPEPDRTRNPTLATGAAAAPARHRQPTAFRPAGR